MAQCATVLASGSQSAPEAVFSNPKWPKSCGRGAAPLRTPLLKGDTPLRNPPCPTSLVARAADRATTFWRNFHRVYVGEMGLLGLLLAQLGNPIRQAGLGMQTLQCVLKG